MITAPVWPSAIARVGLLIIACVACSVEAIDELAWGEDFDLEIVWIDREEVAVAGDERVGMVGGRERDEVVIVGVATDGRFGSVRLVFWWSVIGETRREG